MSAQLWQTGSAVEDGPYRYHLSRRLDNGYDGVFSVIMCNPSTANATEDDPTIRRLLGFADRNGCGELHVTNLFAWRATDPHDLARASDVKDIVGPDNRYWLERTVRDMQDYQRGFCVVAWGASLEKLPRSTCALEIGRLKAHAHMTQLWCFGTTKAGHPRHPLYLKKGTPLQPWPVTDHLPPPVKERS